MYIHSFSLHLIALHTVTPLSTLYSLTKSIITTLFAPLLQIATSLPSQIQVSIGNFLFVSLLPLFIFQILPAFSISQALERLTTKRYMKYLLKIFHPLQLALQPEHSKNEALLVVREYLLQLVGFHNEQLGHYVSLLQLGTTTKP
jgi:hypothetical protein